MNTTKSRRNLVSLPERFCNMLDNLVDDEMICNRTDALKQLILEQAKIHPNIYIFKPKSVFIPAWISERKWLTEKIINEFVSILEIADDASENSAIIAIDGLKTAVKGWESIGIDGLRRLRALGIEESELPLYK